MKRRIIISLGVLLGLYVLGGTTSMFCLHRSIEQLSALAEAHRIQVLRADLAASGVRIERDLMAHGNDPDYQSTVHAEGVSRCETALARCGGCHHKPAVQTQLDATRETFEAYVAAADRLFTVLNTDRAPAMEREANLLADHLARQAAEMADMAAGHVATRSQDVAASVRNARFTVLGTLAVAFVASGVIAIHLMRRLTQPVEALVTGIGRVRRGDLTHRFALDADEEFHVLGDAFNDAYESLMEAQAGAYQAEKMAAVGKLAAGIAHEIGNPLASISAVAQMLRREHLSDRQAEKVDLIMREVERTSAIVRELLMFSRSPGSWKSEAVNINAVLDRAVSLLRYDKRMGRTKIICRFSSDLGTVHGDADGLLQVFTNVLINALDALSIHPIEEARVVISAKQERDMIVIRFEDNGPGMTEAQISKAFDPFFTTKEPGAGTGLGLWVCYRVVQNHRGAIHIESQPGCGATIIIELPAEEKLRENSAEDV